MKFAYEDLSPEQFEELVVHICRKLMGISVIGFSTGPDGGRDARFHGTAELHPSKAAPWVGKVVIQGKHTNGLNRSFSEANFYSESNNNSVIAKELPRIIALKSAGDLDHYMLFANRRLSAIADAAIRKYICSGAGLPELSVFLYGLEQIESLLRDFPDIPHKLNLNLFATPLIVSPDELSKVVEAFASRSVELDAVLESHPVSRTLYANKNNLNDMSEPYARKLWKLYLKDTQQIRDFLSDPDNEQIRAFYESATADFQLKILAKKRTGESFDELFEYIYDLLVGRDPILAANRRLTRAMLFYMYWNCDIGEVPDAPSN
ncbi:MAG: ABC-three component system protein [Terracidiphilus sp.]|jgi:hypothetical protein